MITDGYAAADKERATSVFLDPFCLFFTTTMPLGLTDLPEELLELVISFLDIHSIYHLLNLQGDLLLGRQLHLEACQLLLNSSQDCQPAKGVADPEEEEQSGDYLVFLNFF